MKPYPAYKDSGVPWIGEVPEEWEIVPLKFLSEIVLGKMLTSKDKGGYFLKPYLRAKNLNWLAVDISDTKNMWFSERELNLYRLEKGDLLVSEGGEVGRTCIWNDELDECYIQNSVNRVRLRSGNIPRFFLYQFFIAGQKGHFDAVVNQVSIAHLTKEKLAEVIFIVPPLSEQTAIAAYLDRKTAQIDTLIGKKRRLIELLQEGRTALISHAVTKGLNPAAKMKDSGVEWIGDVPEGWEVVKLGFLATVKARLGWKGLKASEYVDEGYIFLSTPNIKGKTIDFENVNYITAERYFESPEIMLQVGDVLLAKDGSTLGIANVVRNLPAPATVNSSIAVIRSSGGSNSVYLYYFFLSHYFQNIIQRVKGGMGVPHLFQSDLKKFTVICPPLPEQTAIAAYLDDKTAQIDQTIARTERQIELLQEYRTALISAVVTGKIDVREEIACDDHKNYRKSL